MLDEGYKELNDKSKANLPLKPIEVSTQRI